MLFRSGGEGVSPGSSLNCRSPRPRGWTPWCPVWPKFSAWKTRRASRWRWGCWCGTTRTSGEIPTPHGRPVPFCRLQGRGLPRALAYPSVRFLPLGRGREAASVSDGRFLLETRALLIRFPSFCRRRRCRRRHQGSQTNKQSQEARGRGGAGPPGRQEGPAHQGSRGGLGDTQGRTGAHALG